MIGRLAATALATMMLAGCGGLIPLQSTGTSPRPQAQAMASKIEHVSMRDARDFIRAVPDLQLVDVREPDEFALSHIQYFSNRPLGQLDAWSAPLNKEAPILLVCRSGNRSMKAAQQLVDRGFVQVFHLDGGMIDWVKAGYPTIP